MHVAEEATSAVSTCRPGCTSGTGSTVSVVPRILESAPSLQRPSGSAQSPVRACCSQRIFPRVFQYRPVSECGMAAGMAEVERIVGAARPAIKRDSVAGQSLVRSRCTAQRWAHLSHRNHSKALVGCVDGRGVTHRSRISDSAGERQRARAGIVDHRCPAARTMAQLALHIKFSRGRRRTASPPSWNNSITGEKDSRTRAT